MRVLVVVLAALINVSLANSYYGIPRFRRKAICRGLTVAGVRCVSKTQFVMSFQDPNRDQPTECPRGAVCSNTEEICSSSDPVCDNPAKPAGIKGVCKKCPTEVEYNPVCVSDTEYAFCADEKVQTGMRYKCPVAKPYCKAEFNPNQTLKNICTAEPIGTDCPLRQGGSNISPGTSASAGSLTDPGTSTSSGGSISSGSSPSASINPVTSFSKPVNSLCTADGWNADFSDMTCRSYYRCLAASGGHFIKVDFKCVTMNAIYDPITKRCVSDGSFVCPT